MQLTASHAFTGTPDQVVAMTTDAAFCELAGRELGATSTQVTPTGDAQRPGASVRAQVATDPAFASFAGKTLDITQAVVWDVREPDGARNGRVTITVAGLPVTVDAAARLTPTASGSRVDYTGTFTVKVPFLGATIERQAEPFIRQTLDAQQTVGNRWLAEHPA